MITRKELLDLLNSHETIAWDVDSTLINGANSSLFQNFIHNTPDKNHYIVTFRTGDDLQELEGDLHASFARYNDNLFVERFSIPESIDTNYYSIHKKTMDLAVNNAVPDATFTRKYPDIDRAQAVSFYNDMFGWKPKVTRELGATLLVDDIYKRMLPFCEQEGINLLNALCHVRTPKISLSFG